MVLRMAEWKFADGTVLSSGGHVTGSLRAAIELRARMADPEYRVPIFPPPMHGVPLTTSSDFLLDGMAREVSGATRIGHETEYDSDYEDAPPNIRNAVIRFRELQLQEPYGKVY
jgi:hypothetical protein